MNSKKVIIGIAIIFVLAVAIFVGQFHLYAKIWHLDKFLHAGGGLIAGWFFALYFKNDFQDSRVRYILAIVSAVALVGVLWEFAERLSTLYAPHWFKYYFYGGDLNDTLTDLAADLIGGLAIGIGAKQKTS
jgi:hypothetical protein